MRLYNKWLSDHSIVPSGKAIMNRNDLHSTSPSSSNNDYCDHKIILQMRRDRKLIPSLSYSCFSEFLRAKLIKKTQNKKKNLATALCASLSSSKFFSSKATLQSIRLVQ